MTSMKTLEPFADECSDVFMEAMMSLEGQNVDLSTWLQWYAFDVIAAITFHRRFGFMEHRQDVGNMIDDISKALVVAATVGQVPEIHPWLMGSRWLPKLLAWQPFFRIPDPLRTIVQVRLTGLLVQFLSHGADRYTSLQRIVSPTMTEAPRLKTVRTSWDGSDK